MNVYRHFEIMLYENRDIIMLPTLDSQLGLQNQVCLQCLLVGRRVDKYVKVTSVTAFSSNNGHTYKTHTLTHIAFVRVLV